MDTLLRDNLKSPNCYILPERSPTYSNVPMKTKMKYVLEELL